MQVTLYLVLEDKDLTTFSMPTHPVAVYAEERLALEHEQKIVDGGGFAVVKRVKFPATVLYEALHNGDKG